MKYPFESSYPPPDSILASLDFLANSIYDTIESKAGLSITALMKFEKFLGEPIFIVFNSSSYFSFTLFQIVEGI